MFARGLNRVVVVGGGGRGRHRPQARRPQEAPGFSMIEMLVVMAMIAVILAIGIPALQQQMARNRLVGACQHVATHLHLARMEAMRKGFPVVVAPDYERQRLIAFIDETPDLTLGAGEEQVFDVAVPADQSRTAVYFMGPDLVQGTTAAPAQSVDALTPSTGLLRVVVFEPNGSIRDSGAIRLADGQAPEGNIFEIRIEPAATARVEIRKWLYGGIDGGGTDGFFPGGGGVWEWY